MQSLSCRRVTMYGTVLAALVLGNGFVLPPVYAQLPLPAITMAAAGTSTRPLTAAEIDAHTQVTSSEIYGKLSMRSAHYPIDSIRAAAAAASQQWLVQLRQQPIRGIQLDPSGHVGVAAAHDAYAQTQIATRLATPGLSLGDKAYTLRIAVEAFSDMYTPERLPVAERYLSALDALGDSASMWQFEAREALVRTYYLMGRGADVIRHGTRAIALLNIMPVAYRWLEFWRSEDIVYNSTVDALTGYPDARARIEQLSTQLRAATVVAPALVAADSNYYWLGLSYGGSAERWIAGNAKLGTPAAPLVAQYWINRPSSDSATLAVNDGKIRVLEIAGTGCGPCIVALVALQRLHEQFPQIEALMVTSTEGYWGNRLVEPEEEIPHLTDFLRDSIKVTAPVGIWMGKKIPNVDGGMTPEEGPNLKNYPVFGKPMIWIIDGQGIIRRVFTGYSREIEQHIGETVQFLTREATARSANAAAQTAPSSSATSSP